MGPHLDSIIPLRLKLVSSSWALASWSTVQSDTQVSRAGTTTSRTFYPKVKSTTVQWAQKLSIFNQQWCPFLCGEMGVPPPPCSPWVEQSCCPQPSWTCRPTAALQRGTWTLSVSSSLCGPHRQVRRPGTATATHRLHTAMLPPCGARPKWLTWLFGTQYLIILWGKSSCSKLSICTLEFWTHNPLTYSINT